MESIIDFYLKKAYSIGFIYNRHNLRLIVRQQAMPICVLFLLITAERRSEYKFYQRKE